MSKLIQKDFVVDGKRSLINAINTESYITLYSANKLVESLGIEIEDLQEDNEEKVENNSRAVLIKSIMADNDETILALQEYEYSKKYKYFLLYSINVDDMDSVIEKIKGFQEDIVDTGTFDHVSRECRYPKVREYEDTIDIKFSYAIGQHPNDADVTKYPIVVTVFKEEKLVIIKYENIDNALKRDDSDYIKIPSKAKAWFEFNVGVRLNEIDTIPIFRKIRRDILDNPDMHINEFEYRIQMDDDLNGRCSFRATDQDKFPFVTGVLDLAKTFENANDRKKIEDYIKEYEKEAMVRNIGIKWKIDVGDKKSHPIIVVAKQMCFSSVRDKHIIHHVYYIQGVDRERINYVIRYLSRYMEGDN